jgi:hypothetical protein
MIRWTRCSSLGGKTTYSLWWHAHPNAFPYPFRTLKAAKAAAEVANG